MFAGKLLISRVQKINFLSRQVGHNTYEIIYDELLSINSGFSIHQRLLNFLVTEVFRSLNNLNPHSVWGYFKMNCTFLWHTQLAMEKVHSHFEVFYFGITFLEKLRKASSLKNLRQD